MWFFLFEIIGRFLYPFGDEPDFIARAPSLIFEDHSWINPYYWLEGFLGKLDYAPSCSIVASPFSFGAQIDPLSCSESLSQVITRIFITAVVCFPLILIVCFARNESGVNRRSWVLNYEGQRAEALGLSLLLPGITYSLGVLADEQLVLVLSLLVIMTDRRWIATVILLLAILAVDFGNGVVVTAVVFFLNGYRQISKFVSIRMVLLMAVTQATMALVAGIAFIGFLSNISFLADKADAIYTAVSSGDLIEKYPVYLRPAITFMTGVFMTPSFTKIVPAFLILGGGLFFALRKLRIVYANCEREKINSSYVIDGRRERIVDCCAVAATVLLFIFLIPTYSNAKYYLFVVPFLMRAILVVTPRRRIMMVLNCSQAVVFAGLFLYRQ